MGGKQSKPVDSSNNPNSIIETESSIPVSSPRDTAVNSLQSTRDRITKYKADIVNIEQELKKNPTNSQLLSNKRTATTLLVSLTRKAIDLQKEIANYKVGGRKVKKYTQYRKRRPQRRTRKYKQYLTYSFGH